MVRGRALWFSVVLALTSPACGMPEDIIEDPIAVQSSLIEASFAGRFEDGDTFIAVVTGGDAIRAYVCDGHDDLWFAGTALQLPALLVTDDGDELYLAESDEGLLGSLTRGEIEMGFTAPLAAESALFRAETTIGRDHYLGGWIVLSEEEQRGVLRQNTTRVPSRLEGRVVIAEVSRPLVSRLEPARFTPTALRRRTANPAIDFNVVAMGDSYGAGDGAPEVAGSHGLDGVVNRAGERSETWDVDATTRVPDYTERRDPLPGMSVEPRPSERRIAEACHRSGRNGFQVAADTLAEEWPGVEINRESFACSGAVLAHLLDDPYGGAGGSDELRGWQLTPQFEQLDSSLDAAPRDLDALQMSIGGNDMQFVPLMAACAIDPACEGDGSFSGWLLSEGAMSVPAGYARLADEIGARRLLPDDHVLITAYPTPLRHGNAATSDPTDSIACTELGASGFELPGEELVEVFSDAEIEWADRVAVGTMNREVRNAATEHGWTFVDDHLARFRQHGWCAEAPWIGTLRTARERQGLDAFGLGPFDNLPTPLDEVTLEISSGFSGGFAHPNLDGYEQGYGPAIADAMREILLARVRPTRPGDLRVAAQALNGSITVRWDDRSSTETDFRLGIERISGTGEASHTVIHTAANTEYTIAARGASSYLVRLEACHTGADGHESCSVPAAPLRVTNFPPTVVPTGLVSRDAICNLTCSPLRMAWNPVVDPTSAHVYYEVETFDESGVAMARYTTLASFLEAGTADRFRVRSCNLTGCGSFSAAVDGPTATDIRSDADHQLDRFCASTRSTARLAGEPSLDPAGLCRGR